MITIKSGLETIQSHGVEMNNVFVYMQREAERLKSLGRQRSSETMQCALHSFMKFRENIDLPFSSIDKDVIEHYESYLKSRGLCRNSTSFYMRRLRTVYNNAVDDGVTEDKRPFRKVYTGVDKTVKRAISIDEVRRIKELDLVNMATLDFARNMFLFSFYTRGMSFVDMAYLRKCDICNGFIIYRRMKTCQELTIEYTEKMRTIVEKYNNSTQYLLPIIIREDGTERKQYKNQLVRVNRNLKKVGELAGLNIPLTSYVSRHAWASIARNKNIPLNIISKGLGHNNESTTQIYLDSIKNSVIDKANRSILDDL